MTSSFGTRMRRKLFGTRARLNDYELILMDAIKAKLASPQQIALDQRLEAISSVRRLDGGREVDCYQSRRGEIVLDASHRLTGTTGEEELARFRIEGPDGTSNEGTVWLVNGVFFSMEFKRPTEHADAALIRDVRVELKI